MSFSHEELQRHTERDFSGTRIESTVPQIDYRVLAHPQAKAKGFILDVDGTLYQNEGYRKDVARRELEAIGTSFGWTTEESAERVKQHRDNLSQQLGRPARLTETVLNLGLTREWWDQIRTSVYRPEEFLTEDTRIATVLGRIVENHKVAVATNSPSNVAYRILKLLGVKDGLIQKIDVVGPDKVGVSKPDPEFFVKLAQRLGIPSEEIVSIGDDEQNDAYPAIEVGMGAIVVSDVNHLSAAIERTTHEKEFEKFDLEAFALSQYRPGDVRIVTLTGRAGAGKTTTAKKIVEIYQSHGVPAAALGLDAFFIKSSAGRKAWLEEGKQIGPEEYAKRSDQAVWWNFEKAEQTLNALKSGEPVHLTNIYDRANKGELTGELKITPDSRGMVVVFEGVAAAHLSSDEVLFVAAHPKVRRERLLGRDIYRAADAAVERFKITQSFENRYFDKHAIRASTIVDNSNGYLLSVPTVPQL